MQEARGSFELQLEGYRLATAEILYHLPDHPGVLQSFIWQHYDCAPTYPRLHEFIHYWHQNITARLYKIYVERAEFIIPAPEVRFAKDFTLQ